jgi:U3 small nucleolar ribonucleoprotein component
MIPNAICKVQMFSQVTKTSAICKHAIHWETMGDLKKIDRFRDFLLEEDLDFRPDAFNSYNE